jgi:hypothetical protein
LKAVLVAMIDVGWVKILGWQLNNEFGYSLFESRHSVVDVKPEQSAVQYTVSMEATAIQNKVVIPSSTKPPQIAPVKPESPTLVRNPVMQPKPASAPTTGG